jgi:vacuolar-type H+-ATPase subunit I/STV1
MNTRIISLVVITLLMQACATMNESECLVSDWRTIGYEDGAAGYPASRIGEHRQACAKHGIAPDLAAYQQGRDEGLRQFCQPNNGFNLGARGGTFNGACPADLATDFSDAYQAGRQLHTLQSRVNSSASQIAYKQRQLDSTEDQLKAKELGVISNEATIQERAQMLLEAKELNESAGKLKAEIADLEQQKALYERDLDRYRMTVAYNN